MFFSGCTTQSVAAQRGKHAPVTRSRYATCAVRMRSRLFFLFRFSRSMRRCAPSLENKKTRSAMSTCLFCFSEYRFFCFCPFFSFFRTVACRSFGRGPDSDRVYYAVSFSRAVAEEEEGKRNVAPLEMRGKVRKRSLIARKTNPKAVAARKAHRQGLRQSGSILGNCILRRLCGR